MSKTLGLCTLPPEIVSEIFQAGTVMDRALLDGDDQPKKPFELLVAQICSYTRKVALATPGLWCFVQIDRSSSAECTMAYMERSCAASLTIRLDTLHHQSLEDENHLELLLDIIIPHSHRWRKLSVACDYERSTHPVVNRICGRAAPGLRYLSITVNDVDRADPSAVESDIRSPHIFKQGTPYLKFVRLRGLAMHLFRPQLDTVVTLHLDQTRQVPLTYAKFRDILTCSPFLTHLSLFGEMILPSTWPHLLGDIHLPRLESLRVTGVSGEVYSGVLIALHAPRLESLTLKDMQEHDLDPLWQLMDLNKFASVKSLHFCDFEVSLYAYEHILRTFSNVTTFSTMHSSISESRLVDLLLEQSEDDDGENRWPLLKTLSFPMDLDADEVDVVEELICVRKDGGYPVSKIVLKVGAGEVDETAIEGEIDGVEVVIASGEDLWPSNSAESDQDDIFLS